MNSKFDPFKNSPPIPHNFGQVPQPQGSSKTNLTPILLIGGLVVVIAVAVAYNIGKSTTSKVKEE